jgi:hypothetical protein
LSGLTNGIGRNDHFETLAPKDRHLVKQNLKDPEVKKHLLVWKKYKRDNGKGLRHGKLNHTAY